MHAIIENAFEKNWNLMHLIHRYDADGSGHLDVSQFLRALRELNVSLEPGELEELVHDIDVDGTGSISIADFATRLRQAKRDHMHVAGVFVKQGGVHKHFEETAKMKLAHGGRVARKVESPKRTTESIVALGAHQAGLAWFADLRAKQEKAALLIQAWYRNWARNRRPLTDEQPEMQMPSKADRIKLFHRMDANSNGFLSQAEIEKGIFETFPRFSCKPALICAYKAADTSGDGFIDLSEFRLLLTYLVFLNNKFHKFKEIASDGDRRLTADEFHQSCAAVGVAVDRAEVEQEFNRIGAGGGGHVSFDEFCVWCARRKAGMPVDGGPPALPGTSSSSSQPGSRLSTPRPGRAVGGTARGDSALPTSLKATQTSLRVNEEHSSRTRAPRYATVGDVEIIPDRVYRVLHRTPIRLNVDSKSAVVGQFVARDTFRVLNVVESTSGTPGHEVRCDKGWVSSCTHSGTPVLADAERLQHRSATRIQAIFRGSAQRATDEREFRSLIKQAETMMSLIAAQGEGNDSQQQQVVGALLERLRQQRQIIESVRRKQPTRLGRSTSGGTPRRGKSAAKTSLREQTGSRHLLPTTSHSNQTRAKHSVSQPNVKLQLTESVKLQRQTAQIGKVLREAIASKRSLNGKPVDSIRSVFQSIDKDGSGTLDNQEFSEAMKRLGLGLTNRQVQQCIEVLDADKDGAISLTEFLVLVHDAGPLRQKSLPRSTSASNKVLGQAAHRPLKTMSPSTHTSHAHPSRAPAKTAASTRQKKASKSESASAPSDGAHKRPAAAVLPSASSANSTALSTPSPAKKRSAKKKGAVRTPPGRFSSSVSNSGENSTDSLVETADVSPAIRGPHACLQFAMGWQWPVASTHLLLGRYSEALLDKTDVQKGCLFFKGKSFSRRHAIIRNCTRSPAHLQDGVWSAPRFEIEVLSKNGLTLNGVVLQAGDVHDLEDTDLIRLGKESGAVEFRFREDATDYDTELPWIQLLKVLSQRARLDGMVDMGAIKSTLTPPVWPEMVDPDAFFNGTNPTLRSDGLVSIPELVTQLSAAIKTSLGTQKLTAGTEPAAAAEDEETRIFLENERAAAAGTLDEGSDISVGTPDANLSPDAVPLSPTTVRRIDLSQWSDSDDSIDAKNQDVQSEAVAEDADAAMVRIDAEEYARRVRYDANHPATPLATRHRHWESPLAPDAHSVVLSPKHVDDELPENEPLAAPTASAWAPNPLTGALGEAREAAEAEARLVSALQVKLAKTLPASEPESVESPQVSALRLLLRRYS